MGYSKPPRLSSIRPMKFGIQLDEDLREPLCGSDRERLRTLFLEHGLLLFPGQALSLDEQIDVMEAVGPVLRAKDGVGYVSTDETKGHLGRSELIFHSDLDFSPYPYKALSLQAIDVPDRATSTRFASNRNAYDRLSDELKARLEPLSLMTGFPVDYDKENVGREIPPDFHRVTRPPIVGHPDTGKPMLSVSQQAVRFEGMSLDESNALLRELFDILYATDNIYEHFWRNGDFVIWDNLAFQHARSALVGHAQRTLQRVAVGEKSIFDL